MKKVSKILDEVNKLSDRKLSRALRKDALSEIEKLSKTAQTDQTGILQVFRDNVTKYGPMPTKTVERGGTPVDREKLYGLGPKHKKSDPSVVRPHSRSLSTRYSPDRVGVQARRLADGVYQDPYTNKIYDWNDGFTTEEGEKFNGGSVDLQTDLVDK